MREKLHKLIDMLFDSEGNRQYEQKKRRPMKVIWKNRICHTNPLAEPIQEKLQDGQRITPSWIEHLDENQIFVFGSNTRGIHDGGASFTAVENFGAIVGQAEGPQGNSYAIPTDGATLEEIQISINRFVLYAEAHPHLTFLVTEIGCGTAGYAPYEIAPMFIDAIALPNIYLPKQFWKHIMK